jgi:Flp pilus assembly protein TadD
MKTTTLLLVAFLFTAAAPAVFSADAPDNTNAAAAKAAADLAAQQQKQGRFADAVASLEKATQLDATQPDYFSALGIALSQRMNEADFAQRPMLAGKMRKAFARSVELDPKHLPGLIGLARFYANAPEIAGGDLGRARELALRVRALNPFLGELELANVAERAEDFAEALARYEAALQLQPKNAALHVSAGRMLVQLGRKDEARTRFTQALEIDPQREAAKKALAELEGAAAH